MPAPGERNRGRGKFRALPGPGATTARAASCDKASLELVKGGTLTIGTDNPAYPPWFGGGELVVLEQGPPEQMFEAPLEPRTRQFLQRIIEAGRL